MRTPHNDPGLTDTASNAGAAGSDTEPRGSETHARRSRAERAHDPERRCILTGDRAAASLLVRLAVDPDGHVFPDALAKAPGRGAWIGVDRAALEMAQAKGKLRGALMHTLKAKAIHLPDDLGARVEAALARATLDRLGLEARGGFLLSGAERIEAACRGGTVALLLHAADAADDGKRKLAQAWRVGSGTEGSGAEGTVIPVSREQLSAALGRENAVHLALIDDRAANRVAAHLGRWRFYMGWAKGAADGDPIGDGASAPSGLPASSVDALKE
jgi:predicted RNA-binding protein YlxR (DUF448 family)